MGEYASQQRRVRKRAHSESAVRQHRELGDVAPLRRSASYSNLQPLAQEQPPPLLQPMRTPPAHALARIGSLGASVGNALHPRIPDRRWRSTKAMAVATDLLQALISVIATLPGGGPFVNVANYAAGPALALSAVPAELADLMEDRERWDDSNWRQIALQPARNMAALQFVIDQLRPPADNGQTRGAAVMRERPPLTEIDEFGDGISSLGNVLNLASGLATLGATVWSSGADPLYLNTGGAVLSGLAAMPDLWDAIRHDPSRSQLRRTLLGVSVALNGASAVAGAVSAQLWNDEDNTASIVSGLISSVLGLVGSLVSETAELIDREGMQMDDWNGLYLQAVHRLWSAFAQLGALPSNAPAAPSAPGAPPSFETTQPALGGWAWWSRHGAAMISAWDEVFNAPLVP